MRTIVKHTQPFSLIERDELLTPFSSIIDRLFNDSFPSFSKDFGIDFFDKGSYPKIDITDHKDKIKIEAEIPGLKKEDVSVEINNDILTIKGTKQTKEEGNKGKQIWKELKKSSFQRSIMLNINYFETEKVDAKFENGILEITIPKKQEYIEQEEEKPKQIKIN